MKLLNYIKKVLVSLFRTRYRIVRDGYAGYEVQWRGWWNPFWVTRLNTWCTQAQAIEYLKSRKYSGGREVVYRD